MLASFVSLLSLLCVLRISEAFVTSTRVRQPTLLRENFASHDVDAKGLLREVVASFSVHSTQCKREAARIDATRSVVSDMSSNLYELSDVGIGCGDCSPIATT